MTENNEIKYTEEQVMNALLQMTPETKAVLFSSNINSIMELANNEEFAKDTLNSWVVYANAYIDAIKAVLQFIELLHIQENNTVNVIESMAEIYKRLSREERLQFSERIAEESDLNNSLDMLKSTWRKFLSHLAQWTKKTRTYIRISPCITKTTVVQLLQYNKGGECIEKAE